MITIGVTGHRFLAEVEKLTTAVDSALAKIERVFGDPKMLVMSSLAEGADRLITRQALARGNAALIVPLPALH